MKHGTVVEIEPIDPHLTTVPNEGSAYSCAWTN
jgi:hypothetical protein